MPKTSIQYTKERLEKKLNALKNGYIIIDFKISDTSSPYFDVYEVIPQDSPEGRLIKDIIRNKWQRQLDELNKTEGE